MVGQYYTHLLSAHPYFKIAFLAASSKSAGKSYEQALDEKGQMLFPLTSEVAKLPIHTIDQIPVAREECRLIFSAVGAKIAKEYEPQYATAGLAIVTNASTYRMARDIPLLIPEINPGHIDVIVAQKKNRGWDKGFIVAKPNCSLQGYLIPLFPLHQQFKIVKLIVTTMQAISGAGYFGVSSFSILDNLIPYIPEEEKKSETELLKILGNVQNDQIIPADKISTAAHCNRVAIVHGHTACVSVQFEKKPTKEEILEKWSGFKGLVHDLNLPTQPCRPIIYREEKDRPQPRYDRDAGNGMAISVGRLRDCPVFDYRFVSVSHNVLRGAAGGGVLIAELLYAKGLLG